MKKFLMASAALMLGAAPMAAIAQDMVGGTNSIEDKAPNMYELTKAQQAEYDQWPENYRTAYVAWPVENQTSYWSWPAESRTSYWAWPANYQDYYWTLTPAQQDAYWSLTADQRTKIAAMTPAQKAQAWTAIEGQVSANASASAEPKMVMKSGEVAQPMATPKTPNAEYPLCTNGQTDNCVNPRAAGKNYGNKPLDYWPGQPASEVGG